MSVADPTTQLVPMLHKDYSCDYCGRRACWTTSDTDPTRRYACRFHALHAVRDYRCTAPARAEATR